ncbi:MAG: prenyltransferase/squalene oxidase repeat-containing protein [Pirellula sp.]
MSNPSENNGREDLNRLDIGIPESQAAPMAKNQTAKNQPIAEPSAHNPTARKPTAPATQPTTKTAATTKSDVHDQESKESTQGRPRKNGFWSAAPSWLISTVIHVAAILGLAAWNIEPIKKEINLLLNIGEQAGNESDALEEFSMDNATADMQSDNTEDTPSDVPTIEPTAVDAKVEVDMSSLVADAPEVSISGLSESLAPAAGIAAQSNAAMRAGLNSRSSETKRELLKKFGGTTETERAVSMALKWLAQHQNPQTGAWTWSHSLICSGQCDRPGNKTASMNGATGMALMCFLGAGQTHMEGEYKETVFKGLSFLIQSMKVQGGYGAWWAGGSADDMYGHGIAAIAMCEAYGMTRDPRLQEAAQLSINYLTPAQNPQTGGWHYTPYIQQKMPGDTSVVGWQMMAIKSAAMSGLVYDIDTIRRANFFLDTMMVPGGFGYHYSMDSKQKNPLEYRAAMTACGVLCRMYSGWKKDEPSIKAAVAKFAEDGPSKSDIYYNYYATQAMKQYGGAEWDSWNNRMRDQLVSSQVQTGHGAGSWFVDNGHSSDAGGRLYITCMSTMMLEVYYRYMPLYAEQAEEDAFKL